VTPLATVRVEWRGDVPVAGIDGEVDASNVEHISQSLHALVTNESMMLVVDLSHTRYLDSAGINLLFALGDDLGARQIALRLVVTTDSPIARMLAITGLDRTYRSHPTVGSALAG
jgi:anti-anti-sigma factor